MCVDSATVRRLSSPEKDSPSRLAFRPPGERAFESPLPAPPPGFDLLGCPGRRSGQATARVHGSATRFFAHVATFRTTRPVEWPPHAGLHRERHGGRRRHLELAAGGRRRVPLRGGAQALHGGDQRRGTRRTSRRRDRDRRHGLPRGREGLVVQLAHPRGSRRGVRVRRAEAMDRVHGRPRGRLRRSPLHRDARDGRHERRLHEPHRLRDALAHRPVQRHRGRRDRDQRGAVRDVGLPGAPRHRRPGGLSRRARTARLRPHDRAGEDGARPVQRSPQGAGGRAPHDRGRRPGGARRPESGRVVRPREAVRGAG